MEPRGVAEKLAARVLDEYQRTGFLPAGAAELMRDRQRRRWLAGEPVAYDELCRSVHEWAAVFRAVADRKRGRR